MGKFKLIGAFRYATSLSVLLLSFPGEHALADEVEKQINLSSNKWRPACSAEPLIRRLQKQPRQPNRRITVHYTDTPKNFERPFGEKLCHLFNYATTKIEGAKKELWGDIPYHFYISADGQLGEARNTAFLPDSNTYYERDGHIAVVLEGNVKDKINPAQKRKLFSLLSALQKKYAIPKSRIATHKDFAETNCPGPAIIAAVEEFKKADSGRPSCERVTCSRFKPRCEYSERMVNIAQPGTCCPVWRCERIYQEEYYYPRDPYPVDED